MLQRPGGEQSLHPNTYTWLLAPGALQLLPYFSPLVANLSSSFPHLSLIPQLASCLTTTEATLNKATKNVLSTSNDSFLFISIPS